MSVENEEASRQEDGNGHDRDALQAPLGKLNDNEVRLLAPYVSRPLASQVDCRQARGGPVLLAERMDTVEPQLLRWLWPAVVPLGKLTLLVGDPGLGKSLVTLDLAARVSRGVLMPDGTRSDCGIGEVLLLSAEDDPADTIRPRLDAADALPEMITCVRAVQDGKKTRGFNLEADVAALEGSITTETRLIIIDPITAYLGRIDSHVTGDVRGLLAPLAELAARRGVAVVAVSHLNKSGGPAMYRTTGSLAFVAAARAVWAVGRHQEDENRVLMLPVKLNLAKNVGGFSYRIKANSEDIPSVVWQPGRIAGDATDLLAHEGASERAAWQEASDWLRERLAAGPAPAKDLQGEALASGLTRKSLWTASVRLGIVKSKSTFSGGWTWALPSVEGTKIPSGAEDFQDSTPGKVGILGAEGNLQGVEL